MENNKNTQQEKKGNYVKFFTMIGTSMLLMYLLTYLNSADILGHAWFSETRLFMTLIMGSVMTLVMLTFMKKNYQNRRVNIAIVIGAVLVLFASIALVRSQITVTGVDYMEGMIPHHSIAILTSEHAKIKDLRVQELANEILAAQEREIQEMEWLINDIRSNGIVTTLEEAQQRSVPSFSD